MYVAAPRGWGLNCRQCCGSRKIFIPDPDFFSIPDLGSNNNKKEEGEKDLWHTFFAAINFFWNRYTKKFVPIDKN
jgi:hypothetical protein